MIEDFESLRAWIGREETRRERIDAEALRRFAAVIDEPLDVETHFPSLGHMALFLPLVSRDSLGPDGHPRRGGFLPPVSLPRRMYASASIEFHAPLPVGETVDLVSRIADVSRKDGRTGELVFVEIERRFQAKGALCLLERQTIVYRGPGAPTPPVEESAGAMAAEVLWRPGAVDLFRFSAATNNAHRIHYDLPFARSEEGYPGLVVHGPFTAAKLCGLARAHAGAPLSRFEFRGLTPLFADQPIRLRREGGSYLAIRCDGATAMEAKAV